MLYSSCPPPPTPLLLLGRLLFLLCFLLGQPNFHDRTFGVAPPPPLQSSPPLTPPAATPLLLIWRIALSFSRGNCKSHFSSLAAAIRTFVSSFCHFFLIIILPLLFRLLPALSGGCDRSDGCRFAGVVAPGPARTLREVGRHRPREPSGAHQGQISGSAREIFLYFLVLDGFGCSMF